MFGERKESLTSAFFGIVLVSISKHDKEAFRHYLVCSVCGSLYSSAIIEQPCFYWIFVWSHGNDLSFEFLVFPKIGRGYFGNLRVFLAD